MVFSDDFRHFLKIKKKFVEFTKTILWLLFHYGCKSNNLFYQNRIWTSVLESRIRMLPLAGPKDCIFFSSFKHWIYGIYNVS